MICELHAASRFAAGERRTLPHLSSQHAQCEREAAVSFGRSSRPPALASICRAAPPLGPDPPCHAATRETELAERRGDLPEVRNHT